jgi:phosphonate transport system substrate-binding protein
VECGGDPVGDEPAIDRAERDRHRHVDSDDPQIIKRNVAIGALIRGDVAAIGMNFGHQKARKAYPVVAHGKELMAAVTSKTDDNRKYLSGVFLTDIKDSDDDYVRSMYETIGVKDFSKFVGD